MLSGALVFVDNATYLAQLPHPLITGKHAIIYDLEDKKTVADQLRYYIKHEEEAAAIARAGYLHTRKYHMAVNRVDMLLSVVQSARLAKQQTLTSPFNDSFLRVDDMTRTLMLHESI
jgi:hypothetical protein